LPLILPKTRQQHRRRPQPQKRAKPFIVSLQRNHQEGVQEPSLTPRDRLEPRRCQQTRRILDRSWVPVSPAVDKVRVDSPRTCPTVALRLIVEREREIQKSRKRNTGPSMPVSTPPKLRLRCPFPRRQWRKAEINNEEESARISGSGSRYLAVNAVKRAERRRNRCPFTTPSSSRTPRANLHDRQARHDGRQRLYEGRARSEGTIRSHHLHAYRLGACLQRFRYRSPHPHRPRLRQALHAEQPNVYKTKAQNAQRPRSHPSQLRLALPTTCVLSFRTMIQGLQSSSGSAS